jgi:hypothetical protein
VKFGSAPNAERSIMLMDKKTALNASKRLLENILKHNAVLRKRIGLLNYFGGSKHE